MFRKELWKKFQAAVVAAAVALSPVVMPVTSYAAETQTTAQAETTVKSDETAKVEEAAVTISVNTTKNTPATDYQLTVKSDDAAKYGFTKPEADKNKVTVLDALADIHAVMYGADKVKDELKVTDKGWITNCFGSDKGNVGYAIDDTTPSDVFAELKTDNTLYLYLYNDTVGWSDKFLYFGEKTTKSCIHKDIVLTVNTNGYDANWNMVKTPVNGATVELRDADNNVVASSTTDENGNAKFTVEKLGTYTAVITKADYEYYNPTNAKVIVEHQFGDWKTVKEATVFEAGEQERTCACGEKETREIKKLTPSIKVNTSSVTLEPKKGTANIKVTFAKGDSVKAYKSADTKIVTVDKNGKLTAGTKTGKTTVTVTLASGKTAKVTVNVAHKFSTWKTVKKATVFAPAKQQRKCACGKVETRNYGKKLTATIKVNASSVTLKTKQSTSALKVTGLANGDSIKNWKSANTKIVKVAKNGKLTAGTKTGKTYVTVTLKSGKTAKITVKVQKTTVKTTKLAGVPKKISLVAGKKYTLKPSKSPITSQEKITYKSANTKVATVDAKGVISAKKAGTVKVTVKSGKKTAVVTVTVKKK